MRTVLVLICSLYTGLIHAQQNFVLNPSFEEYYQCPTGIGQIKQAKFWTGFDTTGVLDCWPTYCNTCATSFNCSIPKSGYYYQSAHSGYAMILNQLYFDSSATNIALLGYIKGKLAKPLAKNTPYCVSFYINLAESSRYAINSIGAYIDNGSIDSVQGCLLPAGKFIPQIQNTSGFLTDTANWVKIESSFVAKGGERYITIGNFLDAAHTPHIKIPDNDFNNGSPVAGYLIDDVSVIAIDTKADAGPDTHVAEDSAFIGRPPEVGLECTWAVLGSSTVMGTGAGIKVKPSTTTSYVVTQILCGTVTRDTVKVDVWPAGINSVNGKEQVYSLSPNPVQQKLHLSQQVNDGRAVMVSIYEATGKQVYAGSLQFADNKAGVNVG
ncbi:MAG: hypothetical protein ABI378_04560, partial [Chitinophagaceae bacterium]